MESAEDATWISGFSYEERLTNLDCFLQSIRELKGHLMDVYQIMGHIVRAESFSHNKNESV